MSCPSAISFRQAVMLLVAHQRIRRSALRRATRRLALNGTIELASADWYPSRSVVLLLCFLFFFYSSVSSSIAVLGPTCLDKVSRVPLRRAAARGAGALKAM